MQIGDWVKRTHPTDGANNQCGAQLASISWVSFLGCPQRFSSWGSRGLQGNVICQVVAVAKPILDM